MKIKTLLLISALLFSHCIFCFADDIKPKSPPYVPPVLQEWVRWVKEKHPEWECASMQGSFQCVWPGTLSLNLRQSGAKFSISVETMAQSRFALPGAGDLLPHNVKVSRKDGAALNYALSLSDNLLYVSLQPGKYLIEGEFLWSETPREIPVPDSYGVIKIDGDKTATFRRGNGVMLFEGQEEKSSEGDLMLYVMRKVTDGSPLIIESVLDLRISGASRSVDLGEVLIPNSTPVSVESDLTHQLSPDGRLSLQIKPGAYKVTLHAVMQQPIQALRAPKSSFSKWPKEEVWTWIPDNTFRAVEIQNVSAVSAELMELPEEWKGGAHYLVPSGEEVTLKELRRGEEKPPQNVLSLAREFWLDLDGASYTVVDKFSGIMNQTFRLNALPELRLGRASIVEEAALITKTPGSSQVGIEVRDQSVNVTAVSKIEKNRRFSAVGWDEPMRQVQGTLHISPAWKLLHMSGPATVRGSWVESWTLLDVFISLLLVIGISKLFGVPLGVLAGGAILFNHAEFLEPRMVFIHLVIAFALLEVMRDSAHWFSDSCRLFLKLTYLLWAIEVLTFSKLQFTQFLFPQLEAGTRYRTFLQGGFAILESHFLVWPILFAGAVPVIRIIKYVFGAKDLLHGFFRALLAGVVTFGAIMLIGAVLSLISLTSGRYVLASRTPSTHPEYQSGEYYQRQQIPQSAPAKRYKDKSFSALPQDMAMQQLEEQSTQEKTSKLVQSGPAIPSWRWKSHSFTFGGPVDPEQKISVYLLSPVFTRLLSIVRIVLLLLLGAFLLKRAGFAVPKAFAKVLPGTLVALLLFRSEQAFADTPSPELLKELEDRLSKEICQSENCSAIESLGISVTAGEVTLSFKVMSDGTASFPLPGPLDELSIARVLLNGELTESLRRDDKGFLWVKVGPGRSSVEAFASIKSDKVHTLQFRQKPQLTSFLSSDWELEGLLPSGSIKGALRLIPRASGDAPIRLEKVVLPSWYLATRSIRIGEKNEILTTIDRIGQRGTPEAIHIALFEGERITTPGIGVENDTMVVRFGAWDTSMVVQSTLPTVSELSLSSQKTPFVSEEWRLYCQSTLRCTHTGLRPNQTVLAGKQLSVWKPFPGEAVKIGVTSLEALEGELLTIDSISHQVKWGFNLLEGEIHARIRNTQQAPFSLEVPLGATIKSTTVDGSEGRAIEAKEKGTVLLNPGEHEVTLNYTLPWNPSAFERAPSLSVSAPSHNVAIRVIPSQDRWILWVGGLRWGPAVLFWAKLLFVVLICLALCALGVVPLSYVQMGLLGFGLATLPMVLLVIPLIWLSFMKVYQRFAEQLTRIKAPFRIGAFLVLSFVSIALFYEVVKSGLIVQPPMLVVGNSSSVFSLNWFVDHTASPLPQPWVFSLPMWCWRATMLLWSTWLSVSLISWLKMTVERTKELAR